MKKTGRMSGKTEGEVRGHGKEGRMRGGEEKAISGTREPEQRERHIKGSADLNDRSRSSVHYNGDGGRGWG